MSMTARLLAPTALAFSLAGCGASSPDRSENLTTPNSYAQSAPESAGAAQGAISPTDRARAREEIRAITAVNTPGSQGYRVGPLDMLSITVFKVEDLSKTVQVSENGSFSYPLVGQVQAGGRTVSEIEKDLAAKLGGNYLRDPQVTVLVKEYNSHRITVESAVKKAGVFPMQGPMSLLQAIATAGGLEEVSDGTVLLFRRVDGQTNVARFSMNDLRAQRAEDPPLSPGDIVMVPASDLKVGMQYILRAAPMVNALRPF